MTTKRSPRLTGRSGEYYVAAELNRMGFDTIALAGNYPGVDAVVVAANKSKFLIQVKTQTGYGWVVNINERHTPATPNMYWVLVLLPYTCEAPRFWVIPDAEMRGIIQGQYDDRPHTFTDAHTMCRIKTTVIADRPAGWDCLR